MNHFDISRKKVFKMMPTRWHSQSIQLKLRARKPNFQSFWKLAWLYIIQLAMTVACSHEAKCNPNWPSLSNWKLNSKRVAGNMDNTVFFDTLGEVLSSDYYSYKDIVTILVLSQPLEQIWIYFYQAPAFVNSRKKVGTSSVTLHKKVLQCYMLKTHRHINKCFG